MSDPHSNFKSSILWPNEQPERPEEEHAFEQLAVGLVRFADNMGHAVELAHSTESPIETILGSEIATELKRTVQAVDFAIFRAGSDAGYDKPTLLLVPQFHLSGFRYDFALKFSDEDRPRLLIECDGKDFHSSEQQIANDHKKDLAALAAQTPLLRFPGSLINRRPRECVREIMNILIRRR